MMWGSSDDVIVMLNHFKGEKIFEILFIYNKEKPFENTNNPCCSVDEPEAELMHDVLQFLHRGILNLKYVLSHDWRCRSTVGNILKKLLSDFMPYIIIHIEVHSGNRVAQPFLQLSLCLAVLLSHPTPPPPPQFPAQEECGVIDDKSLQTALENFLFTKRKLVFSPLHSPSWAKQGRSAQFTAEPDNKIMINIGLHNHPIRISLCLWCYRQLVEWNRYVLIFDS